MRALLLTTLAAMTGAAPAVSLKRGQVGATRVLRTVDLGHIPQAIEPLLVLGG